MFLLNIGYYWNFPSSLDGLQGAVLLAVYNLSIRVDRERRSLDLRRFLMDPQLYLSTLDPRGRTKACARLASYRWFQVPEVQDYDSSEGGRRRWEVELRERIEDLWPRRTPSDVDKACADAIEFQDRIGCTHVIIPAPLIAEREDEGESAGVWLDAGIRAARELDVTIPLLATVAISEGALNEAAFEDDGLIEGVVDHVTARSENIEGVYIVIVQTRRPTHPFQTSTEVIRAYIQLANRFRQAGMGEIIVNFADLAGLVACGVGATWFATGPSSGLRYINIEGFLDDGGGVALPYYYSHKTAGEYLSETDLRRIVNARVFRPIIDQTKFSEPLVRILLRGGSAASVPSWAESQNNLRDAQRHFVQRMVEEGRGLAEQPTLDQRLEKVRDWLADAEAKALLLERRVGERHGASFGRRAPVEEWTSIIEEMVE
ncbi:MAG: hypothetical protein JRI56_07270 [Deltaproteobacteria bacterium]|nr:hypothetical protein [Deltaproteobacteria bacterium]